VTEDGGDSKVMGAQRALWSGPERGRGEAVWVERLYFFTIFLAHWDLRTNRNHRSTFTPDVPVPISCLSFRSYRLTASLPNGKNVTDPITKQ
jgi:hypothetical protein